MTLHGISESVAFATNVLTFNHSEGKRKPVRDGLSSVVKVGEYLWVACDEGTSLDRLKKEEGGYAQHTVFPLEEYIELPAGTACEIDIEGIDYQDHYIWITGSHSLKRKKPKPEDDAEKQIKRLAKVEKELNRYIIARIPMVKDPETGELRLYKSCPHPENPDKVLTAATLKGKTEFSELMEALKDDKHFKDFMQIPGKDNGFDVEGLIVDGHRLFLGLRGPVLRGWAIILEVEVEDAGNHTLHLKSLSNKTCYNKHFLNLSGMGIREMVAKGEDILILAGPTMDLDGVIAVFRWKGGLTQSRENNTSMSHKEEIMRLFDTPYGHGESAGKDKAEGMTWISDHELLLVYDSPSDKRKIAEDQVLVDVVNISELL